MEYSKKYIHLLTMAKKMALVPIEMLTQMKRVHEDLTPLTNPNKDQVLKKMGNIESILKDKKMPEDVKTSRLNEEIKQYSFFADKMVKRLAEYKVDAKTEIGKVDADAADAADADVDAEVDADADDIISSVPPSFQPAAKLLLRRLKYHSDIIRWDPKTYEVTVRGRSLKGSNIIDLFNMVLRSRNVEDPVYGDTFLKVLADLNFPEEVVKNRKQINRFRLLKQGLGGSSDDDGGNSGEKQTPSRARSRSRIKKRRVEWTPIKGSH